jgi:hypothetical protein
MKTQDKKFNALFLLMITGILFTHGACSQRNFLSPQLKHQEKNEFTSASFNHFEGGVLFTDVRAGLEILWKASFKGKYVYRENLGFFVNGGLLIAPNKDNTSESAVLGALQTKVEDGKLYVNFAGTFTEVLGMIHTHPDYYSRPEPSPRNDYQYCYLGIHSYIMDHGNLFDAYKDRKGREVYERLGPRNAYDKLPFNEIAL